ncbi:MAG TPA: hypothetical protein VK194_08290 [Candidatus Deferrimicrobium sp.]|nr:hypothetical protein [Candidatus Deferrimicrobium sp.]
MPERTSRLPIVARSSALFLAVVLVAIGCASPTATPRPSGPRPSSVPTVGPSLVPSSGPTVGAIGHATGASDVVLRIEQGGGFGPIDLLATQAPGFTLFGNGVIVFQRAPTTFPEPDANGVVKSIPWRTASLDEGQVQELLAFALGPGGLGTARESYVAGGIADAPNTIFTIRAGGVDKTVVVNALSEASQPGPDTVARAAFATLAKRLQDFDQAGTISSDIYRPDRYRGVLTERDAAAASLDWPWPALKRTDFKEGAKDGAGGPTLPHRTMNTDEIAALKLSDIEGGVQGLAIKATDGKTYAFVLRPLLADEKE